MGFLEHATGAIAEILGERKSLVFVPFASDDPAAYTAVMRKALAPVGVKVEEIDRDQYVSGVIEHATAIFVGGGNSFRLLRTLRELALLGTLREAVRRGVPYLGASAGSNLACPTIRTTNDMPIVEPGSLSALGLIPFQLNPHYLDPDPHSAHQGETRQQRIEEFLAENDVPVLGLREGSWLRVSGQRAVLAGRSTGRLFRRHAAPADIPAGTDVSYLLASEPRFDTRPA